MNIKQQSKKVTKEQFLMRVTPEIAKELLTLNYEKQRAIKWSKVRVYADDFAAGRFRVSAAEPIKAKWDKSGKIIFILNGQHRLYAIIESGCTVVLLFEYADEEDFPYMDLGAARTAADYINRKYAKNLAAVIPMIIRFKRANNFKNIITLASNARDIVTRTQIQEFEARYSHTMDCLEEYSAHAYSIQKAIASGSMRDLTFLFWGMHQIYSMDHFDDFIEDMKRNDPRSKAIRIFVKWWREQLLSKTKPSSELLLNGIIWAYDNFNGTRGEKYPKNKTANYTNEFLQNLYERGVVLT